MRLPALSVLLAAAAVCAVLLSSSPSVAVAPASTRATRTALDRSPDLWATINACDSALHPNQIGIRGSMPAPRHHKTNLYMRFRVQYLSKDDGKWHYVPDDADSGWHRVAKHVRHTVVEAGRYFTFLPPTDGGAHRLRGVVRFRWTRHGEVVHRALRRTEAGHPSAAGADPPNYSAAVCDIT